MLLHANFIIIGSEMRAYSPKSSKLVIFGINLPQEEMPGVPIKTCT